MTLDFDLPHPGPATDMRVDPSIDAADVLARYWNDRMPAGDNIETITWWLRQGKQLDLPPRAD